MVKKMKRIIATVMVLLLLSSCSAEPEWVTFVNSDSTISVHYDKNYDVLAYVEQIDDMINLYRENVFTLTVSTRGYNPEDEVLTENNRKYYTTDNHSVAAEPIKSVISGYDCLFLEVTGDDLREGGIYYFTYDGCYYDVFYLISAKATEEESEHVKFLLDNVRLAISVRSPKTSGT